MVAVSECIIGTNGVDARVNVRQQPLHAGHECPYRRLATPIATWLVDHEIVGEKLVERVKVARVQRLDIPTDQHNAVVERLAGGGTMVRHLKN